MLGLMACEAGPAPSALDQQLYIWQRQWRPSHGEALAASRADFSTLRVLALQAQPGEGWTRARIDPRLLTQDGRPLIAVVRLDGQLPQLDIPTIRREIGQLLRDWQALGLKPVGLEIDHDCASARLAGYAELLMQLRQDLPDGLRLSITALPAWLASPALEAVLQQVDSSVLQVHAVTAPSRGLFDGPQAEAWARAYARRSAKPFYLALPAYGMALLDSADGAPRVESEVPLNSVAARQELHADPRQVAELIQRLRAASPPGLSGLVWFRLPLAGDRRAWAMRTLLAVVRGQPLDSALTLQARSQGHLHELQLSNLGTLAEALPPRLEISARGCEAADAVGAYRVTLTASGLLYQRQAPAQLAAGRSQALGWARCQSLDQGVSRVEP
ncbi:MAG: DUF3142 domain-containing protein [Pseudomonas sp.]|uniref:DUF3142 domain-containing protein n=1 Tax=Pseudomonas sp. TaxID=306 RepID=UPI0033919193